ncbi:hypothetical protein F5B17DRAFT_401047 [Nemania serpens]|nr:hypothetical protein F5B17DRAFT_401047 [Nemania serpens]
MTAPYKWLAVMFVFSYGSDPFRTPINSTCDSCPAEDETRVNMLVWLVHSAGTIWTGVRNSLVKWDVPLYSNLKKNKIKKQ